MLDMVSSDDRWATGSLLVGKEMGGENGVGRAATEEVGRQTGGRGALVPLYAGYAILMVL